MWDLLLKDSLFALEQKGKIKDPNTKFKLAQKNSVCVITIKTSWYSSPPVEWAGESCPGRGLSPFSGFNFMQNGCVYFEGSSSTMPQFPTGVPSSSVVISALFVISVDASGNNVPVLNAKHHFHADNTVIFCNGAIFHLGATMHYT